MTGQISTLVRLLAAHGAASAAGTDARVAEILAAVDRRLTTDQRRQLLRYDDLYDERGLPA